MSEHPAAGDQADFYGLLGVPPSASAEEVAHAYRQAVWASHPDRHPLDEQAAERFRMATEAYDVLSDPERRADYDRSRRGRTGRPIRVMVAGPRGDAASGAGFGAVRVGPVRQAPPRLRRRGRDIHTEVKVGFADAVYGTRSTIELPGGDRVTIDIPAGVVAHLPPPASRQEWSPR